MKKWALAAIVLSVVSTNVFAAAGSEAEFLSAVKDAHAKKDTAAFMALFAAENADPEMMAMSAQVVQGLVSSDVKGISLKPLPEDFVSERRRGNGIYRPNIPVLGKVVFDMGGSLVSMPYGEKDGSFYLAGTSKEIVAE